MDDNTLARYMDYLVAKYSPDTKYLVVAADEMKFPKQYGSVAIIQNTDPRNRKGEHYLLWYSNRPGLVEYFDSFGRPISAYPHIQIPDAKIVQVNKAQLQPDESRNCSLYCLYVLKNRLQNRTMESIMKDFFYPSQKICNDVLVLNFLRTLPTCVVQNRKSCL